MKYSKTGFPIKEMHLMDVPPLTDYIRDWYSSDEFIAYAIEAWADEFFFEYGLHLEKDGRYYNEETGRYKKWQLTKKQWDDICDKFEHGMWAAEAALTNNEIIRNSYSRKHYYAYYIMDTLETIYYRLPEDCEQRWYKLFREKMEMQRRNGWSTSAWT